MEERTKNTWEIIKKNLSDRIIGFIMGAIATFVVSLVSFYIVLADIPNKVAGLEKSVEETRQELWQMNSQNLLRDQKIDQVLELTRDIDKYLRER